MFEGFCKEWNLHVFNLNLILYRLAYKQVHTLLFLHEGMYVYLPAATSTFLFIQSNWL